MSRPTKAIIDLNIFKQNLSAIKAHIGSRVQMMPMVKADAYGHGLLPIAHAAQNWGADFLGVALIEEGIQLRKDGISLPILCVGALPAGGTLPAGSSEDAVAYDISQIIFDTDALLQLQEAAAKANKTVKVHIKLETGMNRLGVTVGHPLEQLLQVLKQCDNVLLEGVFTHFATSDCGDKSYTHRQNELFLKGIAQIQEAGFKGFIRHASCSGAVLDCPELNYDMVRPGIAIYGYYPSEEVSHSISLQPILTWETEVVAVKELKKDETVSYGQTFTASEDCTIAVLPVGYGDGYMRALSNKGYVVIHGIKAPIRGRICMDQMMVDVTQIPRVTKGTRAVLLGSEDGCSIWADTMGKLCGTISYEITLSISSRVPKEYRS